VIICLHQLPTEKPAQGKDCEVQYKDWNCDSSSILPVVGNGIKTIAESIDHDVIIEGVQVARVCKMDRRPDYEEEVQEERGESMTGVRGDNRG
jgi:hypothetical protein